MARQRYDTKEEMEEFVDKCEKWDKENKPAGIVNIARKDGIEPRKDEDN